MVSRLSSLSLWQKRPNKRRRVFAFDDRTGNVLTTVALFAIAAAVFYLARGVFFILLPSLMQMKG
jgi:hypothetical protein